MGFSLMGTGLSADPVMLKWVFSLRFCVWWFSLLMSVWIVQRSIRNRLFHQHFTEVRVVPSFVSVLFWVMIFASPWCRGCSLIVNSITCFEQNGLQALVIYIKKMANGCESSVLFRQIWKV